MQYFIIAGEASGDLHAANLVNEIIKLDESAVFKGVGGEHMQKASVDILFGLDRLAFMGFYEVLKNLRTINQNFNEVKQSILTYKPDVIILIDYPGFNLRIAEWAKKQGFKIVYYISPQVWAWKANRVKKMKLHIDKMLCILPFEKDYYKNNWNWNVEYVGHPLVEVVEEHKKSHANNSQLATKEIIALLPGSRKQEIEIKLPIMLAVAKHFSNYQFVVAKSPGQEDDFYEPFLKPYANVSTVRNDTYNLLMQSRAALVTSGTATLETALFEVPEIVCYKGSNISYQIAKRLIKIKFISLVNLIMNKEVVKELIQQELTVQNIQKELELLLSNQLRINDLKNDYSALKNILSVGGNASEKAAEIIVQFTTSS